MKANRLKNSYLVCPCNQRFSTTYLIYNATQVNNNGILQPMKDTRTWATSPRSPTSQTPSPAFLSMTAYPAIITNIATIANII